MFGRLKISFIFVLINLKKLKVMFKRCRVVRLSTNEKASKIRLNNKSKLSFEPHIQGLSYDGFLHTYQHLYISLMMRLKKVIGVMIIVEMRYSNIYSC